MKESDLKTLRDAVEEIAREAGLEIMKHYTGNSNIYLKADGSEVTDADHAAENIILPALRKLTPDIPIVAEERVAAGEIPDVSGGTFWTVDPLDGTREFINKTGAFVVAIGLVIDYKPVMGIIYHPAMELMYSGYGPGTASKTGSDGVRTPLAASSLPAREDIRVLVNEFYSDMKQVRGYLSRQFGDAAKIDSRSGILRSCQVAEGLADMAIVCASQRAGRTALWDIVPGHAIIESAGGRVETLEGKPLQYDAKDLQVEPHVAISPLFPR